MLAVIIWIVATNNKGGILFGKDAPERHGGGRDARKNGRDNGGEENGREPHDGR